MCVCGNTKQGAQLKRRRGGRTIYMCVCGNTKQGAQLKRRRGGKDCKQTPGA
jgi:hypothetical protein